MAGFDSWLTNPEWIELVRSCLGSIDFDPCSNLVAQEYVKAKEFCISGDDYSRAIKNDNGLDSNMPINCSVDGLQQRWFNQDRKNVFVNPPYSKGNIDQFVDKAVTSWILDADQNSQMIMLVNSATDCKWYHMLLEHSNATLFVKGRIKFWKIENGKAYDKWEGVMSKEKGKNKIGNSPRYLNTLFYFGNNIERFNEVFSSKGIVMVKA